MIFWKILETGFGSIFCCAGWVMDIWCIYGYIHFDILMLVTYGICFQKKPRFICLISYWYIFSVLIVIERTFNCNIKYKGNNIFTCWYLTTTIECYNLQNKLSFWQWDTNCLWDAMKLNVPPDLCNVGC